MVQESVQAPESVQESAQASVLVLVLESVLVLA